MSHLWDRLAEAKSHLAPVQSKYRVLFEDPSTPDEPAKVLVPDPNWMAAALEGNIYHLSTPISVIAWFLMDSPKSIHMQNLSVL